MINIDDRLLAGVTDSELYLLSHITKRLNKEMYCFPSNTTLMKETGWSKEKLQKVKKSLVEKGYMRIESNFFNNVQTSNTYVVTTDLIGCFVGTNRLSEKPTPTPGKTTPPHPPEKPTGDKVLNSIEVLNTSSKEEVSKDTSVESDSPTQEEGSTEPQKKGRALAKEKEPLDPCYHEFVRIWIEAYPDFRFGAVEGRKIKDLIPKLRWHQMANKKSETPEAVCHLWQYIVNYLKRGQSQYSNKSLKYIDSTIDQIIYEIRNGRQQRETPYQKQQRELAELRKRPLEDF